MTTTNLKGEVNAAPFSFTMPVSMKPPLLTFASIPTHDTYRNILETEEFVVNIPHEDILEKLWTTGKKFPYGVNELDEAKLAPIQSDKISPPKINDCVAHMECKLNSIHEAGDHNIVVGEVLHLSVKKDSLKDGLLDVEKIKPVLHLGGVSFMIGDHLRKVI